MSKAIDSREVIFHDERGCRSIVCCCNHRVNLSSNRNDFVFDTNHIDKNINDSICFRVVDGTDYKMGGIMNEE